MVIAEAPSSSMNQLRAPRREICLGGALMAEVAIAQVWMARISVSRGWAPGMFEGPGMFIPLLSSY